MYQVKTVSLLYRCIPESGLNYAIQQAEQYAAAQGVQNISSYSYYAATEKGTTWFKNFLGDMYQLRGYIFGFGIGVTLAVGVVYLYLLRIPYLLTVFIWTIIVATFTILIVGSFLLWRLARVWSHDDLHSHPEIVTMYTFSYIGMAVTFLYFCAMVVMRKRIQLAIGIVKETCKAFATMTGIMIVPIIQAIGMVMFLIPWVIYVFYLASSGEAVKQTGYSFNQGVQYTYSYYTYKFADETRYAFIYMLFCLFWTAEFIVAIGQLVMALCFSSWYFTREKEKISSLTVLWSLRIALVYHLGTAAFGSLIIAIIQTVRAIILYFQKTSKKDGIHGKILKYALCILQCFLWCVEKIMKFINKNAYIVTAIYGYSFCKSARKAFFLILRNILRVSAVTMVSSIVLFLGQMFVPLLTTFICYLCLAYSLDSGEVSGIVAPLVFTFFLSYWVSAMFMEIFGMGIETILVCFIADEEMNKVEHRFADGDLRATIAASEAKREELNIPIPKLYRDRSETKKDTKEYKEVELVSLFYPSNIGKIMELLFYLFDRRNNRMMWWILMKCKSHHCKVIS
jgi:hypothetical protein